MFLDGTQCILERRRGPEVDHARRAPQEVQIASDLVVEDGDVARGLVGDRHPVAVLDQFPEQAAHRDHVVVRVGRENDDVLAAREPALAPDLRDECVEDLSVQRLGRPVARGQRGEVVGPVVIGREVQNRLPRAPAQPDDGRGLTLGGPVHVAHPPRRADARQIRCRGRVEVHRCGWMLLEKSCRDIGVHFPLDRAPHDLGLVFSRRQEDDFARLEDRGHAHRDRLRRDVFLAEEIRRGVGPRDRVEVEPPSAGVARGTRLVEADVAAAPDPQELKVDPADLPDTTLELPAVRLDLRLRYVAARDVAVVRGDVHMVEQVLPHVAVVAVDAPGPHREVLVEVERDDVRKVESFIPMESDELPVHPDGGRAGRETEHGVATVPGPLAHERGDAAGHLGRDAVVVRQHADRQALPPRVGGSARIGAGHGLPATSLRALSVPAAARSGRTGPYADNASRPLAPAPRSSSRSTRSWGSR